MPPRKGVIAGKMSVVEFGRALLDTNDLDPLYTMLHAASLSPPVLGSYILGYLCFYDTGTAAWLTDSADYWCAMEIAGVGKEHARGGDRRHFRGKNAADCIAGLKQKLQTPQAILNNLAFSGLSTLSNLMGRIQKLVGFGPTIAFKTADMLERLWGCEIRFASNDPLLMSKAPTEGAEKASRWYWTYDGKTDSRLWAHRLLINHLEGYLAPPRYERPLAVLETETILCKWNHYLKGSYYIGKGKESQQKGLLRYPNIVTAQKLLKAGVEVGLWN